MPIVTVILILALIGVAVYFLKRQTLIPIDPFYLKLIIGVIVLATVYWLLTLIWPGVFQIRTPRVG